MIRDNWTGRREGKGIGASLGKNASLVNCLITRNYGTNIWGQAAGVYMSQIQASTTRVINCTIVGNALPPAGNNFGRCGLSMRNNMTGYHSVFLVENCIIYSNKEGTVYGDNWSSSGTNVIMSFANNCTTPTMNGLNGGGISNIIDDPLFVDAAAGDYRLAAKSPCIDTGLTESWMIGTLDLDGGKRVQGAGVDMGAYERVPPPGGTVVLLR